MAIKDKIKEIRSITDSKKGGNKVILQIFIITFTIICLFFAFRGINWGLFFQIIKTGNYGLLPLVLLISSIGFFIRALRWRVILQKDSRVSPIKVFWADMVGYLGNTIFPARAGEVIRSVYAGNEFGISASYVFATCMLERIGDVFALIIIGSISLLQMKLFSAGLIRAIIVFLIIGLLGLGFMAILPKIKGQIFNWLDRFSIYKKFKSPLEKFVVNLSSGFELLRNGKMVVWFVAFTVLIWFCDATNMVLASSIFHLQLSYPIAFVLLAAMGLSSAIPSTPGYVGVYQLVSVLVLVPLGYNQETAVAFITVMQIIGFIVIVIWGGIGVFFFPMKKNSESISTDTSLNRVN